MSEQNGSIDTQPLVFNDFSGGLTENFLQGNTKRYAIADNFWITVDHKLETRYGTILYDTTGYTLPGNTFRVSGLFTGINETVLFAHANRTIYIQTPDSSYGTAWAAITGPTSNEALSTGDQYAKVTTGEFQHQTYYTSDASALPGKLFKDQTDTWKAVTAGLPKLAYIPNFPSDSSLISACIALANALRSSMISAFNDYAGSATPGNYQHGFQDKWDLSYFATQSWAGTEPDYPGPQPVPTPASAATSEATLYILCAALALAYEHHRNDLSGATPTATPAGMTQTSQLFNLTPIIGSRVYHSTIVTTGSAGNKPSSIGISAKLALSGVVSSPLKAAAFLNDLAQKWYWHQLSPFSHSSTNDITQMSRYLIKVSKIPTIYSSSSIVQITPNISDFVAFANWIQTGLNKHTQNTGSAGNTHAQPDPYGPITLAQPFDFDSAALSIFWARWLYGQYHVYDSIAPAYNWISYVATTGSANITSVTSGVAGIAISLSTASPGQWLLGCSSSGWAATPGGSGQSAAAQVTVSGSGTATVNKYWNGGGSPTTIYSFITRLSSDSYTSIMHYPAGIASGPPPIAGTDTSVAGSRAADFLTTSFGAIGTSLATWITLGSELILALGSHENNSAIHQGTSTPLQNDLTGTSSINSNPFFVPTAVSLSWAAFYRYNYTVGANGISYLNQGPPAFSGSVVTFPSYPIGQTLTSINTTFFPVPPTIVTENVCATVAAIPLLTNTSTTNYDTTISVAPLPTVSSSTGYFENLTTEIYRTTDGGTTFYYLTSLTNSTTSYSDVTNETYPRPGDDALATRKVIYTAGGVVANDPPPLSKYIHQLGGFMYYGGITDSGQFFPQRLRQSVQNSPDACPATFFDDLEDEMTGISSTRSNPIVLCKNSIYRISGAFTATGQGLIVHDRIANAQGCIATKSIVQTEIGVFYAGTDGFYYTDGYQIIKISLDLDKTYRDLTKSDSQKSRIYGAYDKLTRRIWWAMQSNQSAPDNDIFFIFYLDYGVKPSGVFTKAFTNNSWQPSCATFFKNNLIIGDSRGYIFKSDKYTKTDPYVNTAIATTSWKTAYIPWKWRSCAVDCGTTFKRKWVTRIHATGQNIGNAAIQVNSINGAGTNPDGSSSSTALAPIQYVINPMWSDPSVIWANTTCAWKYDGSMDLWRRFPASTLRSDFKQIEYAPCNVVVYKYDNYPQFAFANVSSSGKTATIVTPSTYTSVLWPLDVVDYYISFDTDSYVTKYLITALDATHKIITFTDASSTSVTNTTAKWQINGIKKEQKVKITSIDVHYGYLGDENEAYPGPSGPGGIGGNA